MSASHLILSNSLLSAAGRPAAIALPKAASAGAADRWGRRSMIAALLLAAAGYAGSARADNENTPPSPPTQEEPVEQTPADDDEGRSAWDWMMTIMGDEGGSNDPETGTLGF